MHPLIASRLAATKCFRVVTHYADGTAKSHDTETAGQAENWATGERRKIGRRLVDRKTGNAVQVTSVAIERI